MSANTLASGALQGKQQARHWDTTSSVDVSAPVTVQGVQEYDRYASKVPYYVRARTQRCWIWPLFAHLIAHTGGQCANSAGYGRVSGVSDTRILVQWAPPAPTAVSLSPSIASSGTVPPSNPPTCVRHMSCDRPTILLSTCSPSQQQCHQHGQQHEVVRQCVPRRHVRVSYLGQWTGQLPYDVSAAEMNALNALCALTM